jgi:transcriptional regulator with XRE-family HTH domain
MATRRVEIGLTGETVRTNVARVRKEKGLALRDLSDRMAKVVRPMAHNTISEIERGARRVDVDDLMALAEGLNVSPITLLMPQTATADELVQATGRPPERAELLWDRLRALYKRGIKGNVDYNFLVDSNPPWAIENAMAAVNIDKAVDRGND